MSRKRRQEKFNVYRDGKIHVCLRMCETCIFRPDGFHLDHGRLQELIDGAIQNDTAIVCHDTLNSDNAVCAGFAARHETTPLQLAKRMGLIELVDTPGKKRL